MSTDNGIQLMYFLGIGGIGMSALARYFHKSGIMVCGYDKTPSALTTALELEGIDVVYSDSQTVLPTLVYTLPKSAIEVVITPAVPKDSELLNWFKANGYSVKKRSVVLGELTQSVPTVAIAGTHGKTTTSALTAHLLYQSAVGCNAFVGGIMANYQTNHLFAAPGAITVVEADEYDRSFLTLKPKHAVITSTDADHLDIYGAHDALKESFSLFADRVESGGLLVNDRVAPSPQAGAMTYGFGDKADWRIEQADPASHHFTLHTPDGRQLTALPAPMPGRHNLENTTAAVALALTCGATEEEVRKGLSSFRGIHRRFEYQPNTGDVVFIDDYAHHPEELRATITAVRERHPGKRITGVFQPHLFSRTRDFADGFAESLALLDEVVLLDIYPARELPIPGIDSQWLLDKINHPHKKRIAKSQLLPLIREHVPEVLLTLGAGDIDREVEPLRRMLEERRNEP